jgi:hypothetical protein
MPLPSYQFSGAVYPSPSVGTTTFNLTTSGGDAIGFLDPAHIKVFTSTDGDTLIERFRPAQWEFNTARTQIILTVATVSGEAVVVRRVTPITGPFVDVPDGINLPAQKLRDLNLYNLYVTQEQYEANTAALAQATAANAAVGTALSSIANQLPYVRYANRAAVPTNPGSAVSGEVLDSTNMQTFTPLTGRPGGFVGSSSLIVRMRYDVGGVTWVWIDYRPADADARYLLKSQVVDSTISSSTTNPASANAVRLTALNAATAIATATTANTAAGNAVTTANAAQATAAAAAPLASPVFTGDPRVPRLNGGPLAGLRNRIINGDFRIDQRNDSGVVTIFAGGALAYTADQWFAYCTGANVSAQRMTGSFPAAEGDNTRFRFTGASGITGIGLGQRIESWSCQGLNMVPCRLSFSTSNTSLAAVNWQVFYPNFVDGFGTLVAPTKTLLASGTVTVNSTYQRFDVAIPPAVGPTGGIEVVFSVGAQTSGEWRIGQVQFEPGDRSTPFEQRPISLETTLCQRFYVTRRLSLRANAPGIGATYETGFSFPVPMRVVPTTNGPTGASTTNLSTSALTGVNTEGGRFQIVAAAAGDLSSLGGLYTFSAVL